MTKTPFWYQVEDSAHCAKRTSTAVGHEPRVGKSGIAILTADRVNAKLVLIVCPANVVENWLTAIDDFRKGGWIAVVVSAAQVGKFLPLWRRLGIKPCLVVLDEFHYFGNRDAQRTKAVYGPTFDGTNGVVEGAGQTVLLSGTPITSWVHVLWPSLRACAPDLIMRENGKPMSYSAFCDRYVKRQRTPFGLKIVGSKNAKELRDKLINSGFLIRRTRREVFGRDIQAPQTHYIKPPAEYRAQLKTLTSSAAGKKIEAALASGGIKALIKLEKDPAVGSLRQLFGMAKVPGVVALAQEELDADPKAKVVVAAWHTDVVRALAKGLSKYGALTYYGGSGDRKAKNRINERFLTDPKVRVICCQIVAAGLGLDFSSADLLIMAEESYVGTDNEQVWARIFNANSPNPKFITRAVLKGTLDEAIASRANGKLRDAAKFLS